MQQEDEDDDDRENSCNSEAVNMVRSQVKDVTLTPHQDKVWEPVCCTGSV